MDFSKAFRLVLCLVSVRQLFLQLGQILLRALPHKLLLTSHLPLKLVRLRLLLLKILLQMMVSSQISILNSLTLLSLRVSSRVSGLSGNKKNMLLRSTSP